MVLLGRRVGYCSCRGGSFVYLAAVLEVALHAYLGIASACCHYSNGSRASTIDNVLLAHEVTQPYKAFPRI